jgi:hypothetical protein
MSTTTKLGRPKASGIPFAVRFTTEDYANMAVIERALHEAGQTFIGKSTVVRAALRLAADCSELLRTL